MKKKILSLMLAVVMMLSLSVTAFAGGSYDEETDTWIYTDDSTITISKSYILEGEGTSPAETFYLVQTDKTVTDSTCLVTNIPALVAVKDANENVVRKTIDGVSYDVVGTVSFEVGKAGNSENTEHPVTKENFTITLPEYEKVGVYTYTLQEVPGTTAGVTYRTSNITLVVTVMNNEAYDPNDSSSKPFIRVATVHTESSGDKSDTFTENTYSANWLKVTKTVAGNLGDKSSDETFNFTVTFTTPSGKTWTPNITATVNGAAYEFNANEPTKGTDASGNETYTYSFSLSHGQTIQFNNIPKGVSYEVSEVDGNADPVADKDKNGNYTVSYDGNETGTMGSSGSVDGISTEVTNTYEGEIDTGISLDSLPYILMLIVVAAGVVFMISRKRLSDRF